MSLLKALLRSPYFYLFLFFLVSFVYVPASEAYLEHKFIEAPYSNPEFEFRLNSPRTLFRLHEESGSPHPKLSSSCDVERFHRDNKELALIVDDSWMAVGSLRVTLNYQKSNLERRLRYALPRLLGHLGLNERGRSSLNHYQELQESFDFFANRLHEIILSGDCLEPSRTVTFKAQAGSRAQEEITITNDNPMKMSEDLAATVTPPIYYQIHGTPSWLSAEPKQGGVLSGESEAVELTATCPATEVAKTYESEFVIFTAPSFPEVVEVSLECPSPS